MRTRTSSTKSTENFFLQWILLHNEVMASTTVGGGVIGYFKL